jgi:hypothetical protein
MGKWLKWRLWAQVTSEGEVAQAELQWLKWRWGGSSGSKVVLLEVKCLKWMGCGLKKRWDGLSEGERGPKWRWVGSIWRLRGSRGGEMAQVEVIWHKRRWAGISRGELVQREERWLNLVQVRCMAQVEMRWLNVELRLLQWRSGSSGGRSYTKCTKILNECVGNK